MTDPTLEVSIREVLCICDPTLTRAQGGHWSNCPFDDVGEDLVSRLAAFVEKREAGLNADRAAWESACAEWKRRWDDAQAEINRLAEERDRAVRERDEALTEATRATVEWDALRREQKSVLGIRDAAAATVLDLGRDLASLRSERDALREALIIVASDYCNRSCASTWRTGEPRPHVQNCIDARAAIRKNS